MQVRLNKFFDVKRSPILTKLLSRKAKNMVSVQGLNNVRMLIEKSFPTNDEEIFGADKFRESKIYDAGLYPLPKGIADLHARLGEPIQNPDDFDRYPGSIAMSRYPGGLPALLGDY